MKKQGNLFVIICAGMVSLILLAGMFPYTALADSYTSTTMRLLHYEGTVEIEDSSGKPRAVMENARFNSGEAMKTAASSTASVGLDDGRIVTLDEKSRDLVRCINDISHSLGMKTIAEGVETEIQKNIVKELGIDAVQGYYYSRPLGEFEFQRFLSNNPFEKKKAGEVAK